MLKSKLRKKILKIRKYANKNNIKIKFDKVFNLIKKNNFIIKIIGGYFPINYEVDDMDILERLNKKNYQISLPVIKKNFEMDFYKWSFKDSLKINQYGIPEPETIKLTYPDVILVPLVAFDKKLNRIGYGRGYYDRKLRKLKKINKNVISVGLAYSFQRCPSIPTNKYDFKLDYIFTERGIISSN